MTDVVNILCHNVKECRQGMIRMEVHTLTSIHT